MKKNIFLIGIILSIGLFSCEKNNNQPLENDTETKTISLNYGYFVDLSIVNEIANKNEGEFILILSENELTEENISTSKFYTVELHTANLSNISNGTYSYNDYALNPMTFFAYEYKEGDRTKFNNGVLHLSKSGEIYSLNVEELNIEGSKTNIEFNGKIVPFTGSI